MAAPQGRTHLVPTVAGCAVWTGVAVVALLHSRPTGPAPTLRPIADAQAHEFYVDAARAEEAARHEAEARFRGSPWSRDDEFHSQESRLLRTEAARHHTSVATMVDALDRGMHEHWSTGDSASPSQAVLPCRPRLSY